MNILMQSRSKEIAALDRMLNFLGSYQGVIDEEEEEINIYRLDFSGPVNCAFAPRLSELFEEQLTIHTWDEGIKGRFHFDIHVFDSPQQFTLKEDGSKVNIRCILKPNLKYSRNKEYKDSDFEQFFGFRTGDSISQDKVMALHESELLVVTKQTRTWALKFDETCVIVRVDDLNNLTHSITKWDDCVINCLYYHIHIFKNPVSVRFAGYKRAMRIKCIIKPDLEYKDVYNEPNFETLFGKRFSEIDNGNRFLFLENSPNLIFQQRY